MSKSKTSRGIRAMPAKRAAPDDVPQLFRLVVEVGDLDAAIVFYTDLLGVQGRKQAGRRCHFDCGRTLNCLSREDVHDAPAGSIVVRPWGERSFYAEDPWGNPLCFVEEGTVYTG